MPFASHVFLFTLAGLQPRVSTGSRCDNERLGLLHLFSVSFISAAFREAVSFGMPFVDSLGEPLVDSLGVSLIDALGVPLADSLGVPSLECLGLDSLGVPLDSLEVPWVDALAIGPASFKSSFADPRRGSLEAFGASFGASFTLVSLGCDSPTFRRSAGQLDVGPVSWYLQLTSNGSGSSKGIDAKMAGTKKTI